MLDCKLVVPCFEHLRNLVVDFWVLVNLNNWSPSQLQGCISTGWTYLRVSFVLVRHYWQSLWSCVVISKFYWQTRTYLLKRVHFCRLRKHTSKFKVVLLNSSGLHSLFELMMLIVHLTWHDEWRVCFKLCVRRSGFLVKPWWKLLPNRLLFYLRFVLLKSLLVVFYISEFHIWEYLIRTRSIHHTFTSSWEVGNFIHNLACDTLVLIIDWS